jgi:MerR family mercuric resistance operon transcriptional regulator
MAANMPIGAFSRRTGCAIETIRFYEKSGILPPAQRTGRYRRYDASDVARLTFVRRARDLGFTLDDVRALLRLAALPAEACGDVRSLATQHLVTVRARLADLRRMERALADAIGDCETADTAPCPLIATLSSPACPRG